MIYHILKNGIPCEVNGEELNLLMEGKDIIDADIQWYLNNGGITAEDFNKTHQLNDYI